MLIRAATPADARAMAEVDRQSWPSSLATSVAEFEARLEMFAAGQLVGEIDGRIVATAAAQRVSQEFLEANGHRYRLVTGDNTFRGSHLDDGEIYQLIGVGVLPEFRGDNLGRKIVDRQIEQARSLPGVGRIVGFTRPAGYHRHRDLSIEEYVGRTDADGRPIDPVLAFHLTAGARVVSIHADFRPNDSDSCGFGVLIEYRVRDN